MQQQQPQITARNKYNIDNVDAKTSTTYYFTLCARVERRVSNIISLPVHVYLSSRKTPLDNPVLLQQLRNAPVSHVDAINTTWGRSSTRDDDDDERAPKERIYYM